MTARQKILAVANELRLCLGCAAGCCDSASVVLDQMLKRAGLRSRIVSGSFQVKGEDWILPPAPSKQDAPMRNMIGDAMLKKSMRLKRIRTMIQKLARQYEKVLAGHPHLKGVEWEPNPSVVKQEPPRTITPHDFMDTDY